MTKALEVRGKILLLPPNNQMKLKELLRFGLISGSGQTAGPGGQPPKPWTPDELAEAISKLPGNETGIELRTVQLWFQDNDKGISSNNIRWLAQILGCGDPQHSLAWRRALNAAQERLRSERRSRKAGKVEGTGQTVPRLQATNETTIERPTRSRWNIALLTEGLFSSEEANLPIWIFAGFVCVGFASYFLGNFNITYEADSGSIKQIGFLWAPNWTLSFLLFIPLSMAFASNALRNWIEARKRFDAPGAMTGWKELVGAHWMYFLPVLAVCALFVGAFQWVSFKLLPLLGQPTTKTPDWARVALVKPETFSVSEAIWFSGFAYLYMSVSFYFLIASFVVLYLVGLDGGRAKLSEVQCGEWEPLRQKITINAFRALALASMVPICMKLQSAYRKSDSANILFWLQEDAQRALDHLRPGMLVRVYGLHFHYSSFIILLLAVGVFGLVLMKFRSRSAEWRMWAAMALLVVVYFASGVLVGFAWLLLAAVSFTSFALICPTHQLEDGTPLKRQTQ